MDRVASKHRDSRNGKKSHNEGQGPDPRDAEQTESLALGCFRFLGIENQFFLAIFGQGIVKKNRLFNVRNLCWINHKLLGINPALEESQLSGEWLTNRTTDADAVWRKFRRSTVPRQIKGASLAFSFLQMLSMVIVPKNNRDKSWKLTLNIKLQKNRLWNWWWGHKFTFCVRHAVIQE